MRLWNNAFFISGKTGELRVMPKKRNDWVHRGQGGVFR